MVPALPPTKALPWLVVGFFALSFLVYGRSLGNAFVNFDDGMLITGNSAIRELSPASIKVIFTHYDPELYIPLTLLSYQLDFAIGGENPLIYHVSNLVFHTLNALLVCWLFLKLSRRRDIAIVAGLLFVLHPMQTEAVAWAAARKDVLSAFFFLCSSIGYLSYRETGERRTYWVSVVAFLLGLLSKVSILVLPLVLLLLDWREGRKWGKEMLLEKLPYLLLSVIFGIVALYGKGAVLAETSLTTKILLALRSTLFYLQSFFWPSHFSVLYPYDGTVSWTTPVFLASIILLLLLISLTLWTLKWTKEIAFGMALYLLLVCVSFSNLAKAGELFLASDRYAYLAILGLLWVTLLLVPALWSIVPLPAAMHRKAGRGLMVLTALLLAVQSYRQSLIWNGPNALFSHVLSLYPDSAIAHGNVGSTYAREGKWEEAAGELEKAVAAKPRARTLAILGSVYHKLGRDSEALVAFNRAMALEPDAPEPYAAFAALEAAAGRTSTAIELYGKAITADPHYLDARINRGSLYLDRGEIESGIADAREALKLQPLSAEARYNLSIGMLRQDKTDEAMRELAITVQYRGSYVPARLQYGVLLNNAGQREEAIRQFRAVLRIDPANSTAASALRQLGAGG